MEISRLSTKTSVLKEKSASAKAENQSQASGEVGDSDILEDCLELQWSGEVHWNESHQKEIGLQQPTASIFSALTADTIKLTNFTFLWFTDNGWKAAGAATEIMPMEKSFEQVSISGLPLCLCCCPSPVAHIAALADNEHSQGFVKYISNWIDDPGDWRSWPIHKTSGT